MLILDPIARTNHLILYHLFSPPVISLIISHNFMSYPVTTHHLLTRCLISYHLLTYLFITSYPVLSRYLTYGCDDNSLPCPWAYLHQQVSHIPLLTSPLTLHTSPYHSSTPILPSHSVCLPIGSYAGGAGGGRTRRAVILVNRSRTSGPHQWWSYFYPDIICSIARTKRTCNCCCRVKIR